MQTKHNLILGGLTWALGALLVGGCVSTDSRNGPTAGAIDGSRLWAQSCIRCHNARQPGSYSDAQWEVAMMHMRVRANLTAEEHQAILAYLKSHD